ncbi:2Fe-2S iron-sulfur cluster binding domain-containing protein [Pseudomonas sp. Fig-3]|jgi:ferredoxin-NADP reductase/predicted pyridoxine 5'-phosphate oxidase superfamily flavin-nucleotide-binding protein|uniref:2Fe-2S iron-sulfur cluster-binding protein n=1 Tax=Pseudomonas TaxID=286 RepID=UPI0011123734|nr:MULTISPECIES: pyridoxamine 5'-phosphate oxidase family protein [unclassified Pseudomonas]MDR8384463.1 FAD-binding oxidoreductase [Pseudomonas sp. JL2]TNB83132.1 2Fe-2S iron-sulfur cluster binding domain-containing protein [Pseudomonas sp. Fig-3]
MDEAAKPQSSPWHEGELTLQRSVGAVDMMTSVGQRQLARNWMPDQHREFYAQLPFVVLGAVDRQGDVWATLRTGKPGFMSSPDPQTLQIDLKPQPSDPAQEGMGEGAAIGMLGIELHTRRRNRMNGNIRRLLDHGLEISVSQAYGNCPRYINLRQYSFVREQAGDVRHLVATDPLARRLITAADSFYIATYVERDGERQVDASHRGGKPGFVRMDEDGTLTIPDFSGNLFFNTLGNILLNPRAGLIFVDFKTGDLLQMTGSAQVLLDDPEIAAFQGAERLLRFKPQRVVYRQAAIPLRWKDQSAGDSPNSLMTGSWEQAAERLQAEALRTQWRPLRVVRVVDESHNIRSFYLQAADGAGVPRFDAGQHLPVRISLEGQKVPSIRTYSVSSAPSDDFLRISVKREGLVSSHLHDRIEVAQQIEARAPQGHFTVQAAERRPLVLLAAGVGVTPLLSMLREVVYQGLRMSRMRPVWLVQSARTVADLAFREEIDELVKRAAGKVKVLRLVSQPPTDGAGQGYDATGRIDVELLKQLLALDDYDYYLCGPGSFTQSLYDGLRKLRIPDDRIHAETFGPSTLVRDAEVSVPAAPQVPASSESVKILFASSGKEARWEPGSGTLLELAEARGLSPEFSCRGGSCGTCKTRLSQGQVHYLNSPAEPVAEDEVLICCAVPAQGSETVVLDV